MLVQSIQNATMLLLVVVGHGVTKYVEHCATQLQYCWWQIILHDDDDGSSASDAAAGGGGSGGGIQLLPASCADKLFLLLKQAVLIPTG